MVTILNAMLILTKNQGKDEDEELFCKYLIKSFHYQRPPKF
ncbi:Uncharacterized protein dnm_000970 [Desulfonema magnum]|uniref:Uncharacterized protein n=1 Tax=Desulfonema magnum TaxID=45655 RepID=A0A975GJW7_9BACT|nr:Uncharacterized protein dnm_000970 [Desulfonema magnum]